jgi:NAD-dependent dihydropyrimidine dehydrogenase PreA subunit
MAKTLDINMNKCDGDGGCLTSCQHQVFELREITSTEYDSLKFMGKFKTKIKGRVKAFVANPENCIQCGLCIKQCHEHALQFA